MVCRIEVTLQTPGHVQALGLIDKAHLIHAAMTLGAADALVYVSTVIKVNEIRKIVNTNPFYWLIGFPALPDRLQYIFLGVHLRVARHADFGRRHGRKRGALYIKMTIPAVQPETGYVMLVRKLHGLHHMVTLPGHIAGFIPQERGGKRSARQENKRYNRGFDLVVYIFMKYLRQSCSPAPVGNFWIS